LQDFYALGYITSPKLVSSFEFRVETTFSSAWVLSV